MQQRRGNLSTRGNFNRQSTGLRFNGPPGSTTGPSGAASNRDLMPVGGFQGNRNRGRGQPMPNRGSPGNRGNFQNRGGMSQPNQNQRNNNYNNNTNQQTAGHSKRGQNLPVQTLRNNRPPERVPNAPQYTNMQGDNQGTGYGPPGGNVFGQYNPGPYGDNGQYNQAPWGQGPNQGPNLPPQFNNNMIGPGATYTNPQNNYNTDFNGGSQFTNQPFTANGWNTGYNPQIGNSRMSQMPLGGPGYQGNGNMMSQNNWMNTNNTSQYPNNDWNNSGPYNNNDLNEPMDTSNPPFAQTTKEEPKQPKKPAKTAIGELRKSLHSLTGDITQIKHWSEFKDSIQMMYQFFGQLDSAVCRGDGYGKEFQCKDEKNNIVKCVFYEIDRQVPKLTRGQWYRIVGTYDPSKEMFHCVSVRQMLPGETNLMYQLAKKSAEVMKKLSLTFREF